MAIKNHHYGNYRCTLPRAQAGAVLLAFILVFIIASTFYLTKNLNTNLSKTQHSVETGIAMKAAKGALIGYAISYPDKVNAASGPGYLLCPDKDNDGDAEGSCVLGGVNETIGRLPYETLELEDLRDSSGARLWYALSDDYRNFAGLTPLNSDTAGQLTIDGVSDIVAIIFAPGEPFDNQDRAADENDVSNYLEDDNNDLDVNFVRNAGGDFNDRLVVITRQELMEAVEKRVLGEVNQALSDYQTSFSAFPWLSPFANPSTSDFKGVNGTYEGHLPYHYSGDAAGASNRNPFDTSFLLRWNMDIAGVSGAIWNGTTVTPNCLLNTNCGADDPVGAIDDLELSGECTWSTDANPKNIVDCIPQSSAAWFYYERLYDGDKRREYWIYNLPSLTFTGDATAVIDPSISAMSIRSRQVSKSNFSLPTQSTWFYIIDRQCIGDPCSWNLLDYGYINLVGTTNFSNMRAEIPYNLDIDDSELPSWFVDNNWHHLIYIAYPNSTVEPFPGAATLCTAGTDCLVINNSGAPNDDKRTLAMIAGADLSVASPRPNGNLADYFENENSSPVDGTFEKGQTTVNFNDQIKVISTSP